MKTAGNVPSYRFCNDVENYYLTRDDYLLVFKINQPDYEKIVDTTATKLVREGKGWR